jgi:peroxiredoxin
MPTRRTFASLLGAAGFVPQLAKASTVPRPAPEYGFELPGGKQLLLSQHRGKTVMLCFFLTTCPHCKDTAKVVQKLYTELGPQGFQPLAVCINDMAKLLTPDFIKETGITFPCGYGLRDGAYAFLQHPIMKMLYMPTIAMIDRKGTITAQHAGGDPVFGINEQQRETNLRKLIVETMGATGSAPAAKTVKKKAS